MTGMIYCIVHVLLPYAAVLSYGAMLSWWCCSTVMVVQFDCRLTLLVLNVGNRVMMYGR